MYSYPGSHVCAHPGRDFTGSLRRVFFSQGLFGEKALVRLLDVFQTAALRSSVPGAHDVIHLIGNMGALFELAKGYSGDDD